MRLLMLSLLFSSLTIQANPQSNEEEPYRHIRNGTDLILDYQESIKDDGSMFRSGRYSGYVIGVLDTGVNILFCPPSGITVGQIQDLVGEYLKAKPERRHFSGARLVSEALSNHYPCDKK